MRISSKANEIDNSSNHAKLEEKLESIPGKLDEFPQSDPLKFMENISNQIIEWKFGLLPFSPKIAQTPIDGSDFDKESHPALIASLNRNEEIMEDVVITGIMSIKDGGKSDPTQLPVNTLANQVRSIDQFISH